jgi:hypothetical protein
LKQKEAQHQHYLNNKEKYKEASKKSSPQTKKRRIHYLQEIKSTMGCKICGEKRAPCLVFHHRDPKEKEMGIGDSVFKVSKKRILAEIAKCDVLCANCHLLFHWEESNGTIPHHNGT